MAAPRRVRVIMALLAVPLVVVLAGGTSATRHLIRPIVNHLQTAYRPVSAGVATSSTGPWFGLIAPTSSQLSSAAHGTITRVTLGASWAALEPQPGVFNANADNWLASQLSTMRSLGYQVVLDPGLQYPPAWIFSVSGTTRFIDQYGDAWHGTLSTDVPNAVYNSAVRSAEATYVRHLAAVLGPANLASVRVGGLLSGELRYPPQTYNGHHDLVWFYGASAQANAPVPGWRPGVGTTAQASASLQYYYDSLTNYEIWLMNLTAAAFPTVNQQILFPSWGLRPGMTQAAINDGMRNRTNAEINGMISAGLDWPSQVRAIAQTGYNATVYCTWVDAPSQGTTVQQIPPVDYLASLAATYGLPVAGENTGGGGQAALNLTVQRAQALSLTGVMYMSGTMIANGTAGISLNAVTSAATTFSK